MVKNNLDQLIEIATSEHYASDVLDARKEYQTIAGDIYEDDKSYESRMALFLEWYIFDRISSVNDQSLLETIIAKNKECWSNHMLNIFEGFTSNIHGIFFVKKIRDHSVRVLNLFDYEEYEVIESVGKLLFSKSGIFEGRIVPYENTYYFTGNFCFHPEKARKYIKRKIQQINVIRLRNKGELKSENSKLNNEKKMLQKTTSKIDKIKTSLLKSYSEKKISKIKQELTKLETKRSDLEEKCSHLENKTATFSHEIIVRKGKAIQTQLIHKLSYMQLVWERSRLIDINDIYRN